MSLADRRLCHTLTAEHGTDGRFGWQSAEVVQKHEYAYEMCQLQELIIKKQDERWILYLNDEVMGYVEVKKGFLIKEFCFVWDRQKIDQRRQLYE